MVEIIPKKPAREMPFKNIFLFAAGILLLAMIFGYVIIARSEAKALSTLGDLEDSILKLGTREDKAVETKVFDSEEKIKNFSLLLASRHRSSNFFENFAGLIHPKVWISEVNLDAVQMKLSLSGKSSDFKVLEQQLLFFSNRDDFVESLELSKISISKEGEAEFNIDINFKQEFFN